MNLKDRKILTSILVILVAAAAIGGGILAWFTDQSDPINNEFTAGTVSISAG